jgi:hypothetical protein
LGVNYGTYRAEKQVMTTGPSDFRIRNCTADDFDFACPKAWTNMKAGFSANVRHCDACDRNVYMCHTDEDLALYTSLNYCVAIPATEADGPVPKMPGQEAGPLVEVVSRLSGIWRREGEFGKTYDDWVASLKPEDIPEFLRKK